MGIKITKKEFIDLMMCYDVDRDMKLDIDEFVWLLTRGDEINFTTEATKNTFFKIKKGRLIDCSDFI
jgi:hypothetical protein